MSCCGKKRAEWLRENSAAAPTPPRPSGRNAVSETSGLVRYIGPGQLIVTGAHSGNTYHFTFPGETLQVAYEDTFALRAERNLQFIRDRQQS